MVLSSHAVTQRTVKRVQVKTAVIRAFGHRVLPPQRCLIELQANKKCVMRLTRIALIILSIVIVSVVIQPPSRVYAEGSGVEYWAVIIGVSNYLYQDTLNYADDNAVSLYQQLAPVIGPDHIDLLTNGEANKAAIQSSIQDWLAPREDSNDVVLFYFAGHGSEYSGDYDICPYDGNPYLVSSFIWDGELNSWLSSLDSNNIVVILDSCESGGFITGLSSSSQVVMASSAASESSWYASSLQHGVFTYYLLQAIDNATVADTNADYVLTTGEIFNYASPRTTQYLMQNGYIQHPVNYDSYLGGLPLFMIAAISSDVDSATITIDGTVYAIPHSTLLMPNTSQQVIAQSEIANGTNTRYEFLSWNDGTTAPTRTISQGGEYTADYKTQYYLSVSAESGSVVGSGWYDSGATASTGSAQETITNGDTRYVFQKWAVDGTSVTGNPVTISMYSPHTAYADYTTQYYLSVSSEHSSVSGTGWYDTGAVASTGTAEQTVTDGNTRYVFQHWDVDGAAKGTNPVTIYMYAPHTAAADYKTQYHLSVQSKYGDVSGDDWYDSGTTAEASVTPVVGTLIRHKFSGWSGDTGDDQPSTNIYMDQPKSIVATWETDYLYLYLLIGGVIFVAASVTVLTTVHIRNNKPRRRAAKKRR